MRRRLFLTAAAAAALIALPAGWYCGSPWWTLWRMREAARAGDLAALASYFDFNAMIAEGQRQSRATWRSLLKAARPDSSGGRMLIAMARESLSRPARAVMVRPEDLRGWFGNNAIGWSDAGATNRPYVIHRGLDRFEVRYKGMSEQYGPLLTFRRQGLGWRLVGVRWGQQ